jgi:hypothetical protein
MRHALNAITVHHPEGRSMRRLVTPGNGKRHVLGLALSLALVLTSGGLALAATVPAAAATRGPANEIEAVIVPQISVSPTTVTPDEEFTVDGVGFAVGNPVALHLDRASGRVIGVAFPRHGGRFSRTTFVPKDTKAGLHKIIAVQTGGNQASTTITVS